MSAEPLTQLEARAALLAEERARRDEAELKESLRAAEAAGERLLLARLSAPEFAI